MLQPPPTTTQLPQRAHRRIPKSILCTALALCGTLPALAQPAPTPATNAEAAAVGAPTDTPEADTAPAAAPSDSEAPALTQEPVTEAAAPARLAASATRRIQTRLVPDAAYGRTWTRSVTRSTQTTRREHIFTVNDNTSQRLRAQIIYRPDLALYEVIVQESQASPMSPTLTKDLPAAGDKLQCEQQSSGEVSCVDAGTGAIVPWPAWATLDLNFWVPATDVFLRQRWRRTIDDAEIAGWPHAGSDELHAVLSVTDMDSPELTQLTGVLNAEGKITLVGAEIPYDMTGTMTGSFNHSEDSLGLLEIQLNAHIEHHNSGPDQGWTWKRVTSSRLNIETHARETP